MESARKTTTVIQQPVCCQAAAVAARLVQENQSAYAGEPGSTELPTEEPEPHQNAEAAGKRKFEGGFQDGLDGSDPTDGTRKRTGFSQGPEEVRFARSLTLASGPPKLRLQEKLPLSNYLCNPCW